MLIKISKLGLYFILLIAISACAGKSDMSLPSKYIQYRWLLKEWQYPLFNHSNKQSIKLSFDNNTISINSSCNRFYSDLKIDEGKLIFKKLRSTNITCSVEENKQDQLIINAIQNAKIIKIDDHILTLQPSNISWPPITFTASPKANQKGVNSYLWEVDAQKHPCTLKSSIASSCLRIRELPSGNWFLLSEPIEGFTFQKGVRYRLKVLETLRNGQIIYALDGIMGQILIGTRQSNTLKFLP